MEILINCIQWFLLRGGNKKDGSISTLNSVFLRRRFVVWNWICHLNITYTKWRIQWLVNSFLSLSFSSLRPVCFLSFLLNGGTSNWFWSWLWLSNFFYGLWLGKVLVIGCSLCVFLILFLSELSSLNVNKLDIVNSLNHSNVLGSN